uniref:Uncharacterized protein n=1 Tax=Anopheles minimus TaxID=112268 RepID=A0A182WP86_9DIPT
MNAADGRPADAVCDVCCREEDELE